MNRSELKNRIPHGYCKVIASKAGVSTKSVTQFLSGKSNSHKVEMAVLQVLAELADEKKMFTQKIK